MNSRASSSPGLRAWWQSARWLLRASYWVHFLIGLAYLTNASLFAMGIGRDGARGGVAWIMMGPAAAIIIALLRMRLFEVAPIIQALRLPYAEIVLPRSALLLAILALTPPIASACYYGISGIWLLAMTMATIALGLNFILVLVFAIATRVALSLIEQAWPDAGSQAADWLASFGAGGMILVTALLITHAVRRDRQRWLRALTEAPSPVLSSSLDIETGEVEASEPDPDLEEALVEFGEQADARFDELQASAKHPGQVLLNLMLGLAPAWPRWSLLVVLMGAVLMQWLLGYEPQAEHLPIAAVIVLILISVTPMIHAIRLIERLTGSPGAQALALIPGFPRGPALRAAVLKRVLAWSLHSALLALCALAGILCVAWWQISRQAPVLLLAPTSWWVLAGVLALSLLSAVATVLIWFAYGWHDKRLVLSAAGLSFGLATLPYGLVTGFSGQIAWYGLPLAAGLWLVSLLPAKSWRLVALFRRRPTEAGPGV